MRAALEKVSELADDLATGPVVLCTNSQAALLTVGSGTLTLQDILGDNSYRISDLFRFLSSVQFQVIFSQVRKPLAANVFFLPFSRTI